MATGAAAIATAAAPAAHTGVMYFSPVRIVLLLRWPCFVDPFQNCAPAKPMSSRLTPIHACPPAGICAYRSTPATREDGSSADHERKWSAHHLAVPLQRSHLPARACRALQAAERPRQHPEGTMTSWPTRRRSAPATGRYFCP